MGVTAQMNKQAIIRKIAGVVREKLEGEGSGHDWWHIYRVWKVACQIGKEEGADMFVVELTALLHDIADWKLHDGDDTVGPKVVRNVLFEYGVSEDIISHVCEVIVAMSFKGANVKSKVKTLEGKVVQDADRLDAIGAIGIARTFTYGGHKGRTIYDPKQKPVMHRTKEEYIKDEGSTINHFYQKLLLLKNRMNTQTAKQIAKSRHSLWKNI